MELQPELDSEIEVKVEEPKLEEPKEPGDLRAELKQAMETAKDPDKKGRTRDETGKFAKADDPQPDLPKEEKPQARVPAAWSAANKSKFGELPDWAQQEINRREEEVHKGFTKWDEERQFGKQLKDVISPYMPIIQAEGGTPLTAVQDLLNTAYILRTAPPQQKSQLFHNLARQYGVDLGQQPGANTDPTVAALQQQVAQLSGYINQTVNQQKQHEQESITSQIEAFAADPKNIYFNDVRNVMVGLLQSEAASTLQDAYDMAVYARPDIRSSLLATQQQDTEAKRVADKAAKADAARKAGGSVTGSPGISAPANGSVPNRSLREELQANMRAVNG